jgi:hypothetical protein
VARGERASADKREEDLGSRHLGERGAAPAWYERSLSATVLPFNANGGQDPLAAIAPSTAGSSGDPSPPGAAEDPVRQRAGLDERLPSVLDPDALEQLGDAVGVGADLGGRVGDLLCGQAAVLPRSGAR